MSTKKPTDDDGEIHPFYIYRKHSRTAQRMLGLGVTQINTEIERGTIPTPINLTADGRAQGWTGAQLLEHQRKRLAAAEEARRARLATRKGADTTA